MRRIPIVLLVLELAGAALAVDALAARLPERVASHFDAAGMPNGFMTREACRQFMMIFTLALPSLVALGTGLVPRLMPPAFVNIPNRDYWLAPERAKASIDFLSEQGVWFACILVLFLASVDWMLARANEFSPPRFPTTIFLWAMGAFLVFLGLWLSRMFRRFRRPPSQH
jgi:hypothetical protein